MCVLKNIDSLNYTLKSAPHNANYTYCVSQVKCFALLKSKIELSYVKIFAVTIMKCF